MSRRKGQHLQFPRSCSVALQDDPAGFSARLFSPADLELFASEPRTKLQKGLDSCLLAMETNMIPKSCHEMLLPLLRKASAVVKTGDSDQCKQLDIILSARLDQLAEDIFSDKESESPASQ